MSVDAGTHSDQRPRIYRIFLFLTYPSFISGGIVFLGLILREMRGGVASGGAPSSLVAFLGICLFFIVVICGFLQILTFPGLLVFAGLGLFKLSDKYRIRVVLLLVLAVISTFFGVVLGLNHPLWPDGYM